MKFKKRGDEIKKKSSPLHYAYTVQILALSDLK
jgi:hypothetical protein